MSKAKAGLIALAVLVLIQLVPVPRENPPVEEEVAAPSEVRQILRRSCYDCHSHETVWPWYSRIAPLSWLVAYDIREAREHLNFSTWNRYDDAKRRHKLEEAWEEVEEGEMPLWLYLPLHPEARLSQKDRDAIRAWVASTGADFERGESEEDEHEHDHKEVSDEPGASQG
jgi:mono/diheme cytochrome c family protein